jgi:hypothetical protein
MTMRRKITLSALTALIMAALLLPPATAQAHDDQGYIYGKVTTRSGNEYTGLLRWGDEEAFWDDLFHSYKETRPYADALEKIEEARGDSRQLERAVRSLERAEAHLARTESRLSEKIDRSSSEEAREELRVELKKIAEERLELKLERAELEQDLAELRLSGNERTISVLGGALSINLGGFDQRSRVFVARFGDIDRIVVVGSEDAEVTMKSGTTYTVSGYSNDVGGTVHIRDASLGDIDLDWRRIDTIEFMETPRKVEPEGYRLHGTVVADGAEYTGWIQWDSEECLSTDELDGESEDGKLAIEMANIRTIERRSRSSSWVTLKDDRRLSLEGTNDVNSSIRGIMVEDDRYGRLKVSWDAFEIVTFDEEAGSGRGYDEYGKGRHLRGKVTDVDGNEHEGLLVYDVDESETWEMLNGDLFDIEFDIPFGRVKEIRPRSRSSSTVVLDNGETLRLEGGQDVSHQNDGVLVLDGEDDEDPSLIPWDNIEKVEFE